MDDGSEVHDSKSKIEATEICSTQLKVDLSPNKLNNESLQAEGQSKIKINDVEVKKNSVKIISESIKNEVMLLLTEQKRIVYLFYFLHRILMSFLGLSQLSHPPKVRRMDKLCEQVLVLFKK